MVGGLVFLFGLASLTGIVAQPPGWTVIRPGGRTTCVHGAEYAFFFRPGSVNNLVIQYEGGGACWDAASCLLPAYKTSVFPTLLIGQGFSDHNDTRNPLRNWNHLYVPYCSADVFTGDRVGVFGIRFMGRVNARSALDWVLQQVPNPAEIMVTGCSAGSVGATVWAPFISRAYPQARTTLFMDSMLVVMTRDQWDGGNREWDMIGGLPTFVPGLERERLINWWQDVNVHILTSYARSYPQFRFAAFSYAFDAVQILFYGLGGGNMDQWNPIVRSQKPALLVPPNTYAYLNAGLSHCCIETTSFYEIENQNVRLYEWVAGLISGTTIPRDVDCDPNCAKLADVEKNRPFVTERDCLLVEARNTNSTDPVRALTQSAERGFALCRAAQELGSR